MNRTPVKFRIDSPSLTPSSGGTNSTANSINSINLRWWILAVVEAKIYGKSTYPLATAQMLMKSHPGGGSMLVRMSRINQPAQQPQSANAVCSKAISCCSVFESLRMASATTSAQRVSYGKSNHGVKSLREPPSPAFSP